MLCDMSMPKRPSPITRKTKKTWMAIAAFLLLASIAAILLSRIGKGAAPSRTLQPDDGEMAADLSRISGETYSAALLSMHSTVYFTEADFLKFRGLDTLVASHALRDTKEFSRYIDAILDSGNPVTDLFLCPDPGLLWEAAGEGKKLWEQDLERDLCSAVEKNPAISFSVLLPYPYIGYWLELEADKLSTLLGLYRSLADMLNRYPNAKVFFPGAEPWLNLNPANYEETFFDANVVITGSLLRHVFCDGDYAVPREEASCWAKLSETIAREKESPTKYADLSSWHLVFFGDSVLGNWPGSFSIPGYVNGLSDAAVSNFAISGTSASCLPGIERQDFPRVVERFLTENVAVSENGSLFVSDSPEEETGRNLCFLIQYGFNDYFDGAPVENSEDAWDIRSFKGGLRTCLARLREAFPEAPCILMTPTHTSVFQNGMEINGPQGSPFSAYIDAIGEIAEENGAYLIDNYHASVITEENLDEYLSDGVHPNETGRLAIADRIIRFVDTELR